MKNLRAKNNQNKANKEAMLKDAMNQQALHIQAIAQDKFFNKEYSEAAKLYRQAYFFSQNLELLYNVALCCYKGHLVIGASIAARDYIHSLLKRTMSSHGAVYYGTGIRFSEWRSENQRSLVEAFKILIWSYYYIGLSDNINDLLNGFNKYAPYVLDDSEIARINSQSLLMANNSIWDGSEGILRVGRLANQWATDHLKDRPLWVHDLRHGKEFRKVTRSDHGLGQVEDFVPKGFRPIRIGFVSKDFNQHSASLSFGCLLDKENLGEYSDKFEIYLYSDTENPDHMTHKFMKGCDHFREVKDLDDLHLAMLINNDQIDLLIDLGGHSPRNRLKVFRLRPSPIQATGLGFCHTTGLHEMDYIFCDKHLYSKDLFSFWYLNDKGEGMSHIKEHPIYLDSFIHWTPDHLPRIPDMKYPYLDNGYITFGIMNATHKINEKFLDAVCKVLNAMPTSKLLLKDSNYSRGEVLGKDVSYDEEGMMEFMCRRFHSRGIEKDRLIFRGQTSHIEHLETYNEIDIPIDTFPYQGGITTIETLFMGKVPMVYEGGTRAGCSIMNNVQLGGYTIRPFIANDEGRMETYDETMIREAKSWLLYINAVGRVNSQQSCKTVRERLLSSSICNTENYVKDVYSKIEKIVRRNQ